MPSSFYARLNPGEEPLVLGDTEVITVHPFGRAMREVDAWWRLGRRIAFVQVISRGTIAQPLGWHCRRADHELRLVLVAVVSERGITRRVFERELKRMLHSGAARRALADLTRLTSRLEPLVPEASAP